MKSQEPQEKKFRELSEEELKNVTGGLSLFPEECKDPKYQCSHPEVCKMLCAN